MCLHEVVLVLVPVKPQLLSCLTGAHAANSVDSNQFLFTTYQNNRFCFELWSRAIITCFVHLTSLSCRVMKDTFEQLRYFIDERLIFRQFGASRALGFAGCCRDVSVVDGARITFWTFWEDVRGYKRKRQMRLSIYHWNSLCLHRVAPFQNTCCFVLLSLLCGNMWHCLFCLSTDAAHVWSLDHGQCHCDFAATAFSCLLFRDKDDANYYVCHITNFPINE